MATRNYGYENERSAGRQQRSGQSRSGRASGQDSRYSEGRISSEYRPRRSRADGRSQNRDDAYGSTASRQRRAQDTYSGEGNMFREGPSSRRRQGAGQDPNQAAGRSRMMGSGRGAYEDKYPGSRIDAYGNLRNPRQDRDAQADRQRSGSKRDRRTTLPMDGRDTHGRALSGSLTFSVENRGTGGQGAQRNRSGARPQGAGGGRRRPEDGAYYRSSARGVPAERYRDDVQREYNSNNTSAGRRRGSAQRSNRSVPAAAYVPSSRGGGMDRIGILPVRLIMLIGIIAVVLVVATMGVRCAASHAKPSATYVANAASEVQTRVDANKLSAKEAASRFESIGVENSIAAQAGELAQSDNRFQVMAQQAAQLGREGNDVSNKLVKLAVNEPAAVDYVVGFIDKYPQQSSQPYTDPVKKGTVPQLYQWDTRWGYIQYSGTTFGCTGCGPTSFSMVYMACTGQADKTPGDMAALAKDGGFETDYDGTVNDFFLTMGSNLGLNVSELDVDTESLQSALEAGNFVICNVGPGDFTENGHFLVITEYNGDGTVSINDPFSEVNSNKTWDIGQIVSQTIALYAYSA